MTVILYRLTLKAPAIFAALEGEPNSAVSYDFVPGSAMRGMLIGQYMRTNNPDIDASNPDHRRLFFSDTTRFLNAYPACGDERLLPVPSTWKIPKYLTPEEEIAKRNKAYSCDDKDIIDSSPIKIKDKIASDNNEPPRKPKTLSGFTTIKKGDVALIYTPQRVINVHNTRARKSADEQGVYRYDAIASGQSFIGAIYCKDGDVDTIKDLLTARKRVNMGGARSAGYGLMTLEIIENDDWKETIIPQDIGKRVILTFLSDTIIKDDNGEYVTTSKAIESALPFDCTVTPKSLKRSIVGGFNRKWGLPLPQIPVIERGSVIELSDIKADTKAFDNLTECGIGEQCLDGFGRVAINWQTKPELNYQKLEFKADDIKEDLSAESKEIWGRIRQSKNEQTVNERMVGIVFSPEYAIRGYISKTQIARLRTKISDGLRRKSTAEDVFKTFFDEIKGKVADKQFDSLRIDSMSLKDWLLNLHSSQLSDNVGNNDRFVLQLVDAVLERAHKQGIGEE